MHFFLRISLAAALVAALLSFTGCSKKSETAGQAPAAAQPAAGQSAAAGAQQPGASGAAQPGAPASAPETQAAAPAVPPPPPPPREFTLPAGTAISVRTVSTLSTKTNKVGERFTATLTAPLVVGDYVIAPKGADVQGEIVESDPGGKVKGVAEIAVELTSVSDKSGVPLKIKTQPVARQAKSTKKKDAAKIGIGAGVGAAIGAIAGGGKGAAIGAGVGGAGGTGMVMMTRGDPAVIPNESPLSFRLAAPVTVTEKK
jgi:hypothetical protein